MAKWSAAKVISYNDAWLWLLAWTVPMEELAESVRQWTMREKKVTARLCDGALSDLYVCRRQELRVGACKLLVCLLPMTTQVIRMWLFERRSRLAAEVQFSFFCFLDASQRMEQKVSVSVLKMVGCYLERAANGYDHAAWMAGDLLGDHWHPRESLPVLLRVLSKATTIHGRLGAIHGLEHMLNRKSARGTLMRNRGRVLHALERTANLDRTSRVRTAVLNLFRAAQAAL